MSITHLRDIPVKYIFHGDRQEGEALRGQARRVSVVLDNMVRTGVVDDQILRFSPGDGSLIVARKSFGRTVIDVYTKEAVPQPEEPKVQICPCNCNLSLGWVLEVQEDDINGAPLYTVMACNNDGKAYLPYYNVLASDWTRYVVGQPVLMVPYQSMAYICCTDKTGGASLVRGCSPLVSTEELDSDTWRTTYRILPWCAVAAPNRLAPSRWNPDA